jgi:ribosomal protein S18 acetylase RimI-like enzyme
VDGRAQVWRRPLQGRYARTWLRDEEAAGSSASAIQIGKNDRMSAPEITVLGEDATEDAEALGRLLAQVSSRAAPLTAERVRDVLRTQSTSILVARLDGQIVGMALLLTLTMLAGDIGYVEEVVVDQAVRGQHISTALMSGLLELAARKGLRRVELTSRPSRDIANGLYQSMGFRLRKTNCYRRDLDTVAGQFVQS